MKRILSLLCGATLYLSAYDITLSKALTLDEALDLLKANNLEIQNSNYDLAISKEDADGAFGMHLGKLDFIQDFARSNDAGNVFGFKLAGREAAFGDFGFSDFLTQMPNLLANPNDPSVGQALLASQPNDLNYPGYRNFFQAKLKYELPLFTGFAISSYVSIMDAMTKMKGLEKEQLISEQVYQLRKSFYDMALLKEAVSNLNTILTNIKTLEDITKEMIDVGYAKNVDLLEVQAKKGNVQRFIMQMESNQELLYHYISFLLNTKVENIVAPSLYVAMPQIDVQDVLNKNIDIKRAKTGLEIRENMLSAAQASYYPTLGAFAEVATADDTFMGDADEHKSYTIGARLSWNLFHGGSDSAAIEKSKIERLKTRTQIELAKKGIALKVDEIQTEIKTFDAEIASLEKELLLANEIYENYESRYKEQLSSMSDVIIKQSEQIEKILELQMVKNKRNERIFALEKLANGEF
ncbi:MAG: TolC family protein [Sulfurimonas sp.]|nr:TolC family protein [Sulfurimonas sp.]